MSMRPIDVQISIPRSAEVARVAQGDQQQNQMRQQEMVNQSQIHTDSYEKKVRHSEEAEAKKVKEQKDKEKRRQQERGKKQNLHSDNEPDSPSAVAKSVSGKLDILA